ncbi:Chromosome partition protein Smc [Candidatus Gugararchaeum adminiculabundum]|nr:Chromosome partition protein Smc [Candidatus Gugararchaeum adminiculabundum]
MNLLSEIKKDGKQFLRERRTLLLMVIAPLLVLLIMSAIFSGNSTQVNTVAIGVCDLDQSNASQFFISGMENSSQVRAYSAGKGCEALLKKEVTEGRLAAGIVLPEGFEAGITLGATQNISMYLDNSRFQVSPSIEAFVKAAVQDTDQRIGAQFIGSVWERLGTADAKLAQMLVDINNTRTRAQDMKKSLQKTADSLNSLNLSGVRNEIYAANSTVLGAVSSLDIAQSNLTKIESDFAGYDATLNQTESDLLGINSSLANISGYISGAKAGANCSDLAFFAYCLSIDSLNGSVASSQQSIELRIEKVRAARQSLAAANGTIQDFKANIATARGGASDAEVRINNMLGFVSQLELNRQEALNTIADVDASLGQITQKTYEFENIIADSRNQIREITSRSPESIISPMLVTSNHLFGNRPFFDFMLPSLLPLILMFIALFLASTSLVREKNSGTLTRVYVSQVNSFEYAAVKVISYSVVLLPGALLLALVASVLYGAFPPLDAGAWFLVMQALILLTLTFVALGVLIAVHSESESTAFLASLVVGLPMLFLGGLLFPFEFMPPLVALCGMASPLTQAVLSMQAALVYHSPQIASSIVLLLYASVLTLLVGLSVKKSS